jgi:hypothetical protein
MGFFENAVGSAVPGGNVAKPPMIALAAKGKLLEEKIV